MVVARSWGEGKWGVVKGVRSFSFASWKNSVFGCTTMWIYLTPLNYRLRNGYDGKLCYEYFTTIKIFKNLLVKKKKRTGEKKSRWELSTRILELTWQTRECWNLSLGEGSVRGSQWEAGSRVSQSAEAQNLKTLEASGWVRINEIFV